MGTRDAGTAMGLSEFASRPAAEVTAVNPRVFFQVHWSASRDVLLERAATPHELEDAEDTAAVLEWRARDATGQTTFVSADEARRRLSMPR